jgi:hypothetical protein
VCASNSMSAPAMPCMPGCSCLQQSLGVAWHSWQLQSRLLLMHELL